MLGPTDRRTEGATMSENDGYYLGSSRRFHVTAHLTAYMLKGAGYAALVCGGLLLLALLLLAISGSLPGASKEAADPPPDLSMAWPSPDDRVV